MLSTCCCCIPLRVGSFILAIMGIVGGSIRLAYSEGKILYVSEGVWWIIAGVFLFFGCVRNHRKTVLVSLVLEVLALMDGLVILIFSVVNIEWAYPELANDCADMNTGIGNMDIDCNKTRIWFLHWLVGKSCAEIIINIYFWACNYSFYKTFQSEIDNLV